MKDWVNKKDKYGYTYDQIHTPGYAYPDLKTYEQAYEPEEEEIYESEEIQEPVDKEAYERGEEEISEEALELARLREPGGYEDPLGGDIEDFYEEEDIVVPDIFGAKELEKPAAPAPKVKAPKPKPKAPKAKVSKAKVPKSSVSQTAKVMSLFSKAKDIKVPKRGGNREKLIEEKSHAYADVIEAIRGFEGELPASLKKLEKRFKTGKLKPYSKFLDQDRRWVVRKQRPTVGRGDVVTHGAPPSSQVSPAPSETPIPSGTPAPSRASASTQPEATRLTNNERYLLNAPEEALVANKEYLKDGRLLTRGTRPDIFLNGEGIVVTGNHLEATPSRQRGRRGAHARKVQRWVLKDDGEFEQTSPNAMTNFGWDYYPKKTVAYNQGRDGDLWEFESRDRDGNVRKSRMPMNSPVAGKVVHIEEARRPTPEEQRKFFSKTLADLYPSIPVGRRQFTDEQLATGNYDVYPTGWGRSVTLETGETTTKKDANGVDQVYKVYITLAHGTNDSFQYRIGDEIKAGEQVGWVGGQGRRKVGAKRDPNRGNKPSGRWRYGPHVDASVFIRIPKTVNEDGTETDNHPGRVWADKNRGEFFTDRVYISPSHLFSGKIDKKDEQERAHKRETMSTLNLKEGGEVRRYYEGGQVLTAGEGGGQMRDSGIFDEMSSKEIISWRETNKDTLSSEDRQNVNELIIKKKKMERNPEDYIYDRPTTGDETEYTQFVTQERTTQPGEEPGEWGPVEKVQDPPKPENLAGYKPFPVEEITKPVKKPSAPKAPVAVVSADQQKLKQAMDAEREHQKRLREHRDAYEKEFNDYMSGQLQLTQMDPNRFWKNQGTVSKIFAILGSAAGAYSAGRWGGPNIFQKQIDKAITRDIESQKLDREDQIKRRNAAWKRVELMANRLKNTVDAGDSKRKLDIMEKTYAAKAYKANKDVRETKEREQDLLLLKGPLTREQAERLNLKYRHLKINERSIVGRDGRIWLARSGKEAQRLLKDVLPEATKALNAGERISELVKEVGFLDQINPFSNKVAEGNTLREIIKGAIRLEVFGPGVMTDTERRIADKIIANPNAIFTTDAKEVAKINTLLSKMRYGLGQRLRRAGLYLPPSQNEAAIAQLLRVRKQRPTNRNRAQAISDLIKQQDQYDKEKITEKISWVRNEPLPI